MLNKSEKINIRGRCLTCSVQIQFSYLDILHQRLVKSTDEELVGIEGSGTFCIPVTYGWLLKITYGKCKMARRWHNTCEAITNSTASVLTQAKVPLSPVFGVVPLGDSTAGEPNQENPPITQSAGFHSRRTCP